MSKKKIRKRRVGYKELTLAFLAEMKKAEKRYPTIEDPFSVWKR